MHSYKARIFSLIFSLVSRPVTELVSNGNRKSYACTNSQAQVLSSASQIFFAGEITAWVIYRQLKHAACVRAGPLQGSKLAVQLLEGVNSAWPTRSRSHVGPRFWFLPSLGLECGLGAAPFGREQLHQFTPEWHTNIIVSYMCHGLKKRSPGWEAVVPDQSRNFMGA